MGNRKDCITKLNPLLKSLNMSLDRLTNRVTLSSFAVSCCRRSLRSFGLIVFLAPSLSFTGCGGGGVREEVIEIRPAVDHLATVKSILQRYARGEPMGSEAATFDSVVAEVEKVNPEQAKIVDEGLKNILTAAPETRAEASAALLKKISQ